jgi:uncharacterized membrane protein
VNIELRPLRLGEILDRTFQLYRARFLLFLGIAAVSTTLELVWSVFQLGETSLLNHGHLFGPARQAVSSVTVIAGYAFDFGCAALATAAINRAVLAIYEGKPTGIAKAYSEVGHRWLTCVWVNILAFFIAWSPIILVVVGAATSILLATRAKTLGQANAITVIYGGAAFLAMIVFPLCTWLSLRYSLAIPACVQEKIGPLRSLKRSVTLSKESRWRIFLLLLIVGVAWFIVFAAVMMPVFVLVAKHPGHVPIGATIYTLAVTFVSGTLLHPIYGIGLTLFYYDARIRKEGYDVEWMLEHAAPSETPSVDAPSLEPGAAPNEFIAG